MMSLPMVRSVFSVIPVARGRRRRVGALRVALLAVCMSLAAVVLARPASASVGPKLRLTISTPDYVTPGKGFLLFVDVQDVGDAPLSGNLTVRYTFPNGVTPVGPLPSPFGTFRGPEMQCETTGQVVECVADQTGLVAGGQLRYKSAPTLEAGSEGELAGKVEVSGGGTEGVFTKAFALHAEAGGPFAVKSLAIGMIDEEGAAVTQAGADPAEQLTSGSFLSEARDNLNFPNPLLFVTAPLENFRDVVVHVPAGLVGDPTATVRCAPSQLTTPAPGTTLADCPPASQVGLVQLYAAGDIVPLFNMQPPRGYPAAFGFTYQSIVVTLLAKVRPSDDGVDVVTAQAPSSIPIPAFEATLWGAPDDRSHDIVRGHCLSGYLGNKGEFDCSLLDSERSRTPFLRMPTSCTGEPLRWGMEVDTYQHPGVWHSASTTSPAVTGCENVPFAPSFALAPSTLAPHSATGADVTLSIPQAASIQGVAPADLKSASVTLPAGVTLNPSSANGLQACTDAQLRFKEAGAAQCPAASKIGGLTLKTPVLDHEIGGSIFVLSQRSSDPASGELFRIALEIRSDDDGIDIKLPGMLKIDPNTGQITTIFDNAPQLPFETVTMHFEGGAHPVLVTPEACGTYATNATLTGWNGKSVQENAPFTLGEGCGPRGFAPGFTAGGQNPVAGAFSAFALRLTRADQDQELASLSPLTLPPGLLADIGSVPRCSDAQAAAAACPEASRLGNVTVGAGAGATPVYISDGNVYLTGPYKGAPFGLAFVVHAQAGPFDLGLVTVRAALNIDPHTAQASVQTDALPTIVKGVPVRLRDIRVSIDRPQFMLNPTSCNALKVTGTATSTQGASAPLAARFQVGECERLAFKPSFRAATSAHTSRNDGAALSVTVAYKKNPQANIRSVKVKLPRQLASRLTTLQQACTEATFAANPAACPAGSRVGSARAISPILASPLAGPAYFVSHGGARFPELVIVLQGEGVTIELNGETFIDAKNVTTSTFRSLPDAPVSQFKLSLPRGPHSALGSRSNLCKSKLVMPTTITAQNGRVLRQRTRIAVSGCAKRKHKHRAQARGRRG
jgi:hypothetical protein